VGRGYVDFELDVDDSDFFVELDELSDFFDPDFFSEDDDEVLSDFDPSFAPLSDDDSDLLDPFERLAPLRLSFL
jgi:hypothetical protein